MFSLKDYIKKNLLNGYKDGTFTESKIMQISVGYMSKGLLTDDDIAEIDSSIMAYKAELEAQANVVYEDVEELEEVEPINE